MTIELASDHLQVGVAAYGARLVSVRTPDRLGAMGEVVIGTDDEAGWRANTAFFGATIGRYANRIAGGRFTLDGVEYRVPVNEGGNALHGGTVGFDQQVWEASPVTDREDGQSVSFSLVSPAGDMGFPGTLQVAVRYTVHGSDLAVAVVATTDAPTVVNLTNHAYFSLAGRPAPIADQVLQVFASGYLPTDEEFLPTVGVAPVDGTPFDFRAPTAIGERWRTDDEQLRVGKGYDHCFALDGERTPGHPQRAVRLADPVSGRVLELWTDQPGVQVYTGNQLDGSQIDRTGLIRQGDAICLEPQHFPDSPNRADFPTTVLRHGQEYGHLSLYRFSVEA